MIMMIIIIHLNQLEENECIANALALIKTKAKLHANALN